jgi:hypothetical protein
VALLRGESVSVVTVGAVPAPIGDLPMRVYIIGNDGITLCREAPAAVNEGEIVVGIAVVRLDDRMTAQGRHRGGTVR